MCVCVELHGMGSAAGNLDCIADWSMIEDTQKGLLFCLWQTAGERCTLLMLCQFPKPAVLVMCLSRKGWLAAAAAAVDAEAVDVGCTIMQLLFCLLVVGCSVCKCVAGPSNRFH